AAIEELLTHDDVRVRAARVGRKEHQRVLALLGDLQRMVGIAEREHRLARGQRLHDLRAADRHDERWDRDALFLEELLLPGDELLTVDERRYRVSDRDGFRR